MKRWIRSALTPVIAVLPLLGAVPAPAFEVTFAESGAATLLADGRTLLDDAVPVITSVTFQDSFTTFEVMETAPESARFEDGVLVQKYDWGEAAFAFGVPDHRLQVRVTLRNETERPLADFALDPGRLHTSAAPGSGSRRSLDDLIAEGFPAGTNRVYFIVDTLDDPLMLTFSAEGNASEGHRARLRLTGGVREMRQGGVEMPHMGNARAEPGDQLTFGYSFIVAPAALPAEIAVAPAFDRFYRRHAMGPVWEDRRPIGALFVVGGSTPTNPRGFFWSDTADVDDPESFRSAAMAYAARALDALSALDAQGIVVWDMEGMDRPIWFVGDPRMLPILAPEMDAVADEFFAVFREAGFRTGVTLRPTQVYFNEVNNRWEHGTGSHSPDRNPLGESYDEIWPEDLLWFRFFPSVERLSRKIQYAQDRWGCTLFYIDTNGLWRQSGLDNAVRWTLLTSSIFRELRERHPDVLIMPELVNSDGFFHPAYWGPTAPYMELRQNRTGTLDSVRRRLPDAFSVVNVSDGNIAANRDRLIESVARGDILMARGWFADSRNAEVRAIYEAARLLREERGE